MKKLHKLAAATAMALSLGGLSPYASAIGFVPHGMVVSSETRGDTLLFPVFYGRGENFYTISNNDNVWIQGHLRFRGAAWSGELLDMDIILSPGDVFVFRLADVDGDGHWEIDQSLDQKNFAYSGLLSDCGPGPYLFSETPVAEAVVKSLCMDPDFTLIPLPQGDNDVAKSGITKGLIDHQVHNGYVEFIAEGIFVNMDNNRMSELINPSNAGKLAPLGQREVGNALGTSLWSWVISTEPQAENVITQPGFVGLNLNNDTVDGNNRPPPATLALLNTAPFGAPYDPANPTLLRWARDVGNVLSGTAFVTLIPGYSQGIAYNAESIVNFRTDTKAHRINSYPLAGVILHTENPAAEPSNHAYVYGYNEQLGGTQIGGGVTASVEGRISFNNTWGPTLADGDDYLARPADPEISVLSRVRAVDAVGQDSWDTRLGVSNSLAEVEEALRKASLRSVAGAGADSLLPELGNLSHLSPAPGDGTYATWGVPYVSTSANPATGVVRGLSPTSSGQLFTGFYFDNSQFDKACDGNQRTPLATCSNARLQTWYLAFAPTKFFYGESFGLYRFGTSTDIRNNTANDLLAKKGYLQGAVEHLLAMPKEFRFELWDIFESPAKGGCITSPCITSPNFMVHQELSVFSIKNVKDKLSEQGVPGAFAAWEMGRLVFGVLPADNLCAVDTGVGPTLAAPGTCERTFPVAMYSFEMNPSDGEVAHWRPVQR